MICSSYSIDSRNYLVSEFVSSPYDHGYERFKMQAIEQNAFLHEERLERHFINLDVWIRRDTVMAKSEKDAKGSLSYLRYKFQRFIEKVRKKVPRKS